MISVSKSAGAASFGLVVDFVHCMPHVHLLVGGWAITVGKGWSYSNVHEDEE